MVCTQRLRYGVVITGCALAFASVSWSASTPTSLENEGSQSTQLLSPYSVARYAGLMRQAQAITVQVFSDDIQGSGVLIAHHGSTYFVLTNAHVIRSSARLQIQTLEGRLYLAKVNRSVVFGETDLAVLEFESDRRTYPLAKWATSLPLPTGTSVFAAGFPIDYPLNQSAFHFTVGHISGHIPKSLEGGYQVGYSNPILKGMSGGPVLNQDGEVIAINGMHAEPLWGDPYIFADGSSPSPELKPLLFESSWAIPSETILQYLAHSPF